MKNKLKQLTDTRALSKANVIILALYLWFILGTSLFLYSLSMSRILFYILLFALLPILFILSSVLLNLTRRFQMADMAALKQKNAPKTGRETLTRLVFYFAISFGVLFLYYIAYYPGGFSNDSINQYKQAVSGLYNDWHPVLHTLLAFTLPLKLSGGHIASITLFQIFYFSAVLTYAFYTLRGLAGRGFSVISFLIIILNPATGRMVMYPWKDVAFAITALWLFTFVLQIVSTDGQWLRSILHCLLFAIVWAQATIFRHNAILLTVPLLIGIFLYGFASPALQANTHSRRSGISYALVTCILCFAFLFLVKGPLYLAFHVEKPGGRQLETMGLPLTVICDVRVADPDSLDDETKTFTDRLADDDVWETYGLGSFGSIKWQSNYDLIDDVPASDILRMTCRCFRSSPKVSAAAIIRLTDMVYTVSQGIDWAIDVPMVWPNEIGHKQSGNRTIAGLLEQYFSFSLMLPRLLFYYIGIINLLVMLTLLASHKWKEKESWKRFFLALPLFCYNFGSMLLLTNNDFRLFYYSFLLCPVILTILLTKHNQTEVD